MTKSDDDPQLPSTTMELERHTCDRARHSRDARFDGRFFIAVTSTHVYCRPICPARTAKDENVVYFPSAAAAEAAGYRPCLRCRPEASPGTPAWAGTSALVSRALRLISDGALDHDNVEQLADRLGVSARHVRRLFLQHLGATPLEIAMTRRVHFAKKLLDETSLGFEQVAYAAGFGSVRRFNSQIRRTYARTPTELRRLARQRTTADPEHYQFRLAYRPPYDWDTVLAYLAAHATPGVELVADGCYRRAIAVDGQLGTLDVAHTPDRTALAVEVRFPEPRALLGIVERVRRMFDLGADPAVLAAQLGDDPVLAPALAAHPGIRVAGAWDGFELTVCTMIERRMTVRQARALAARIAAMFGARLEPARLGLEYVFPTPARLADAALERAGATTALADSIRALARLVLAGAIAFDGRPGERDRIALLPGIEPWTAEYIAMRALGEPDAFPNDRDLRRASRDRTARELERRAERWRPWRAYAAMLLAQLVKEPPRDDAT